MATLCAQPRCVFFRDLGATPEATEGPSGLHRLRLPEPAMATECMAGGVCFFFFGGKVEAKKKPKLPKVTLRNWR